MPRTHDLTRRSWGHNFELKRKPDGTLAGFVWLTPGPSVGDTVKLSFPTGDRELKVTEVGWTGDPADMFTVVLTETTEPPA